MTPAASTTRPAAARRLSLLHLLGLLRVSLLHLLCLLLVALLHLLRFRLASLLPMFLILLLLEFLPLLALFGANWSCCFWYLWSSFGFPVLGAAERAMGGSSLGWTAVLARALSSDRSPGVASWFADGRCWESLRAACACCV